VLIESGQGSLHSERGYSSYDVASEVEEFPVENVLPEEEESSELHGAVEEREVRMRSIEEELERLAMDEEPEADGGVDDEIPAGARADELEAALWEDEREEERVPERSTRRERDVDVPIVEQDTAVRQIEENSDEQTQSDLISDLAEEYELDKVQDSKNEVSEDQEIDEEENSQEGEEASSDSEDSASEVHDIEAFRRFESISKAPKPEPRNPFAQEPEEDDSGVEASTETEASPEAFGSSSPARKMGDSGSVGEAIVLMRDDESHTEPVEAEPPIEEAKPGVRRIDLAKNELEYGMLDLLQEDVHRLFLLGDVMGALVSLERVVLVAGDRPHVRSFLARNSDKLIQLYEQVFGGFERVVVLVDDEIPLGPDIVGPVLIPNVKAAVDGSRTMREIMTTVDATDVEVATALHHMLRTRRVMFV